MSAIAEKRRRSAVALIKVLLRPNTEILPGHLRKLLSHAIWLYTEADGKWKTQYCSEKSKSCDKNLRRHDHVYQRKLMIDELIAKPISVDNIMENAIGCVITREEHTLLNEFKDRDGWERYKEAGIVVIDRAAPAQASAKSQN